LTFAGNKRKNKIPMRKKPSSHILALNLSLSLALLITGTSYAKDAKDNKETGNSIEFTTMGKGTSTNSPLVVTLRELPSKPNFVPGNYYFFNGADNTKIQPIVGEAEGKKFIQVVGDPNEDNLQKGTGYLVRFIKIPPTAPKEITLGFDIKVEPVALTGWEVGGSVTSFKLFFAKAEKSASPFFTVVGGAGTASSILIVIWLPGPTAVTVGLEVSGNRSEFIVDPTVI
jgi:hypothetical protein